MSATRVPESGFTIRLVELANGGLHEFSGSYVLRYHPGPGNLPLGECVLEVTQDRAKAKRYLTVAHATAQWKAADPRKGSRRSNGAPNRPLTAWTVEIEAV